jgi:hypothetical protein
MEVSTSIRQMLSGNRIFVPSYQRAYSWDTSFENNYGSAQVNVFLDDLQEYVNSSATSKYYFGHFLFEQKSDHQFGIIDGQQRLTTIVIFLSALFARLKSLRTLYESEVECYEDMVRRNSTCRFETVYYDDQLFKDVVIEAKRTSDAGVETESGRRILNAFKYFTAWFEDKGEEYSEKMLEVMRDARCTTHPVTSESEAIQMFIFQNYRGKRPSRLEVLKARFMYAIHLHGGSDTEPLMNEIKNRFETIYKSISLIEYAIREDEILTHTFRVHFNSLSETGSDDKIAKLLNGQNPMDFVSSFSASLAMSFGFLASFFGKDERENWDIHSLVTLGGIGDALPFIIKAYHFGLPVAQVNELCKHFESVILRHRLIGTRADLTSRLRIAFEGFTQQTPVIAGVTENIRMIKTATRDMWWWAYWNNDALEHALQGYIYSPIAKYLLWKYEVHLTNQGKDGYLPLRFNNITNAELEHIAPKTENPGAGYEPYDEEFRQQYLECLGNYMLISKSHNCSLSNDAFKVKRDSYISLAQQREVRDMTATELLWTKQMIQKRKEKIISFIMATI